MNLTEMTDVLLAALQVELRASAEAAGEEDDTCSYAKHPGDSVAIDYAECGGMAWVRLVQGFPSVSGFTADVTDSDCFWGMGYELEVGVIRPVPNPSERFGTIELPSAEDLSASFDLVARDNEAMVRAIKSAAEVFDLVPGSYTPVGPMGGSVGGTWAITVGQEP